MSSSIFIFLSQVDKQVDQMAPTTLPPGFRFHPTDEELVAYYLDRKISGRTIDLEIIPEIDLYKCEPWELPEKSYLPSKDMEWYFYSPRDRKYPNGSRTNRATGAGYWKATGKDRQVNSNKIPVGMKKTLVYYKGRAPHGIRTNWVMHEYRLIHSASGTSSSPTSSLKDSYALCRVFKKTALQMAKSKREDAVSSDLKDHDQLVGDDDNGLEISRSGTENEQDSSILEFAKLPISDASSSEVTQGTTLETTTTKGCLPASYLAADEANSVSDFYFLGVNCSSNLIQDLQTPNYASLQNQVPYSPLELEDFPDHDQTIEEYTSYDKLRDYMNGTIEEIFSLCSSQDNSISQLPLQHY